MSCKTVAILTSGGDAPGMNAAIRAIVRLSITKGIRTLGVRRGYGGLINKDIFEMSIRTVSEIIERGGLYSIPPEALNFILLKGQKKQSKIAKI